MTDITDAQRWPVGDGVRTLWTEEVDRPMIRADIERIEQELGVWLHSLTNPDEYTLGSRLLDPGIEDRRRLWADGKRYGSAVLVAHRRSETQDRALVIVPGIALKLNSSLANENPIRWENLRVQCRTVLSELGLSPPPPGHKLFLTGEN